MRQEADGTLQEGGAACSMNTHGYRGTDLDLSVNNGCSVDEVACTMADRRVRQSGKDRDGDITALCNAGEFWSPRQKASAINDIETETHTYFVREGEDRVEVSVVDGPTGKYLRTDADSDSANNLDNLPDC